jgi:hypothetical protein
MPALPTINIDEVFYLFTAVLTTLAIFWGINKAILISKSH